MKDIFYIGSFPPPFGGATIKNIVLYNELVKNLKVEKFNTTGEKTKLVLFLKLLFFILKRQNKKGIICISSESLLKLVHVLFFLKKSALSNITVFILGGVFDRYLEEKNSYINKINFFKKLYVETEGMKKNLEKLGVTNIEKMYNLRSLPKNSNFKGIISKEVLKCVFLTKICKEKGVDIIFQTINSLNKESVPYVLDFYGHIDDNYKNTFINFVNNFNNVNYKGVIEYKNENSIIDVLRDYDILLFPTKHIGEGIAGILVEAKIAGLLPIVSSWNYNEEIVHHKINGYVLKENTPDELKNAICYLNSNREELEKLCYNSYLSSKEFIIDSYIEKIIIDL